MRFHGADLHAPPPCYAQRCWEESLGPRADTVQEMCVPDDLLTRHVTVATRRVVSKQLEPGAWFAAVPGFPGVWGEQAEESVLADSSRMATTSAVQELLGHRDLSTTMIFRTPAGPRVRTCV